MRSKFPIVILLIASYLFGYVFFQSVASEKRLQRDPATLDGKIFQLGNLSSEQIKYQLEKNIKVSPTVNGKKAIHFSGFSSAICKTYPNIEIEFMAEGVAVAGESPSMYILAPCESGKDQAEIESIYIPVGKLLSLSPKNKTYQFDGFSSQIIFKNSADEWPTQWVLKRVEFKHISGMNKSASFNRSPASVNEQPIVLEF